jgi:hypothetical protein
MEIAMKLFSVLAVGLILAGPVMADEVDENILNACLRHVEAGNLDNAKMTLLLLKVSSPEGYEKCIERADELQSMIDAALADSRAVIADSHAILAEIDERDRIQAQQNNDLIDRDVNAACRELYAEQKIAAMTNSDCVASFRRFGHPDLDK